MDRWLLVICFVVGFLLSRIWRGREDFVFPMSEYRRGFWGNLDNATGLGIGGGLFCRSASSAQRLYRDNSAEMLVLVSMGGLKGKTNIMGLAALAVYTVGTRAGFASAKSRGKRQRLVGVFEKKSRPFRPGTLPPPPAAAQGSCFGSSQDDPTSFAGVGTVFGLQFPEDGLGNGPLPAAAATRGPGRFSRVPLRPGEGRPACEGPGIMGAKRKSPASAKRQDQSPPPPPPPKRPREAEEFTGARIISGVLNEEMHFYFALGLEKFISIAKSLPSTEQFDIVEGYIKVSVECTEILKLLDGERRPESEMLLIFQALESILLRTASDLSHFRVVGMNIVKKLINSYMRLIYAALYSEGHRMSRMGLTLLSAMVTQGPDAARDVYSHFDFNNKFLPSLVKKRDHKGKPDVRMAYIQFALSFLIAGDNTILVHVLELKDFIPDIFRTGLKEDRISIISLLLSTLETKVVHNKNVTKTQKVRFLLQKH
ncbi:hypothetical protein JRQ81_020033 [Phrynocephalus forsythii]|uniref:URB1 N-terminal domain-containing protein n=1 Tax=Phrynocephalus forsythii TaxID=171643 RepID=A0A9Q0XQ25_9SAUR|nr:hypothetical protein JRQ81_020033 [Phrynocephalus forsythii]